MSIAHRKNIRNSGLVEYAIFDFGYSVILPQSTDIKTCRHRHQDIWHATPNRLNDVMQGEYDYDPFAFDVGCLGHLFCQDFQVRD